MAGTSRPPQPGSVVSVHRSLGHLLDDDLHTLCLSFLSARDLLSALCVSQRWRSLERQHLWRALIRKDYPHLYVEHMHRLSLTAKMQYRQLHLSHLGRLKINLDSFASDYTFACQLTIQSFESAVKDGPWCKDWSALTPTELQDATVLGFGTRAIWDNRFRDGPEDMTTWDAMSERKQAAATRLGYSKGTWDSELKGQVATMDLTVEESAGGMISLTGNLDESAGKAIKWPALGRVVAEVLVRRNATGQVASLLALQSETEHFDELEGYMPDDSPSDSLELFVPLIRRHGWSPCWLPMGKVTWSTQFLVREGGDGKDDDPAASRDLVQFSLTEFLLTFDEGDHGKNAYGVYKPMTKRNLLSMLRSAMQF